MRYRQLLLALKSLKKKLSKWIKPKVTVTTKIKDGTRVFYSGWETEQRVFFDDNFSSSNDDSDAEVRFLLKLCFKIITRDRSGLQNRVIYVGDCGRGSGKVLAIAAKHKDGRVAMAIVISEVDPTTAESNKNAEDIATHTRETIIGQQILYGPNFIIYLK